MILRIIVSVLVVWGAVLVWYIKEIVLNIKLLKRSNTHILDSLHKKEQVIEEIMSRLKVCHVDASKEDKNYSKINQYIDRMSCEFYLVSVKHLSKDIEYLYQIKANYHPKVIGEVTSSKWKIEYNIWDKWCMRDKNASRLSGYWYIAGGSISI